MWGLSDFEFPGMQTALIATYHTTNLATKSISFLDTPAFTKENQLCSNVPRL
jgi:hypothetical protein